MGPATLLQHSVTCRVHFLGCGLRGGVQCADVYWSSLEMGSCGKEQEWVQEDVEVQFRPDTNFSQTHRELYI